MQPRSLHSDVCAAACALHRRGPRALRRPHDRPDPLRRVWTHLLRRAVVCCRALHLWRGSHAVCDALRGSRERSRELWRMQCRVSVGAQWACGVSPWRVFVYLCRGLSHLRQSVCQRSFTALVWHALHAVPHRGQRIAHLRWTSMWASVHSRVSPVLGRVCEQRGHRHVWYRVYTLPSACQRRGDLQRKRLWVCLLRGLSRLRHPLCCEHGDHLVRHVVWALPDTAQRHRHVQRRRLWLHLRAWFCRLRPRRFERLRGRPARGPGALWCMRARLRHGGQRTRDVCLFGVWLRV